LKVLIKPKMFPKQRVLDDMMRRSNKIFFIVFIGVFFTILFFYDLAGGDNGNDARFYLDRGINLYKQEKYFEAIDSFRNAIGLNPYYGDAYKYIAEVYYYLGEYKISLENSLVALKYAHNDPDAMLIVANSYRELGDFNRSEEFYKNILNKFPSYAEVYRNLAELYVKMNRLALALSMLNKAERMNKNYWKNYISFGNYYIKSGNYEKAEDAFKTAFNINPLERQVYVTLADFYISVQRYDEAISILESGEKLFENFYSGILLLGDSYLYRAIQSGKGYDKAINKYTWVLERSQLKDAKFKSWLYYKMGLAYENIDKNKAIENYKKAVSLNPENEFIRSAFESFVMNGFKIDSPIREELSQHHIEKAKEFYGEGENKAYFFHLKRAISLSPLSVEPRRRLLDYYEDRGDYYSAYQELKALEKIDKTVRIKDKLEIYSWRIEKKQLNLEKPYYYSFRGLFLADANFFNFSKVFSDVFLYNSQYYNKFKFSLLEYRKKEGIDYILENLRENDYTFFVVGTLDRGFTVVNYSIYDKTGSLINKFSVNYSMNNMSSSIQSFLEWMNRLFPSIIKIGEEKTPGSYEFLLGKENGAELKDNYVAFDVFGGEIKPLAVLRIDRLGNYSSEVSVVSNYKERNYEPISNKYAVKIEFFNQKYLTNLKRILGY